MTTLAQQELTRVTVGVDTHKDVHVAVALDHFGRRLGSITVDTTAAGLRKLLRWGDELGELEAFGLEGTGCYGAGLARFLGSRGYLVVEVMRPNRQTRRRRGKSDLTDAEAAARAVLSGEANAVPKAGDDRVEMIRALRVARCTAMRARTQAINALRALIITAPPPLRDQVGGLSAPQLVETCARLRPGDVASPLAATKLALRSLACRYQSLDAEVDGLDGELKRLTADAAPALQEVFGVGAEVASTLLCTAGDNPDRLRSEAAFARLCGVSPIEASSGKTVRHRLNRGGDRQANAALYRVVLVRLRWHQPTRDYVERRTKEGKSKSEIIRCLKRYVAREVFAVLKDTGQKNLAAA